MKRNYEDPSLELIGRSAAERRLDRLYNRQRSQIQKREPRPDNLLDSKSREIKELPFKPKEERTSKADESTEDSPKSKKSIKEILFDLSQQHLKRRNRLAKSVKLLTKLSVTYLDDKDNAEFAGIDKSDFFRVYADLDRIFIAELGGAIPKDSLDIKGALLEFVDKVVNRLEADASTTSREVMFFQLLKISIGYSSALWYENDSFKFHAIVSKLEGHFDEFLQIASMPDCFDNDALEKTEDAVSATHESNLPQEDGHDSLDGKYRLPSKRCLLELQKQAFVRTLAIVFDFFTFPWAKVSIESLFQRVYLKRDIFEETEQKRISEWQKQIKASKGKTFKGGLQAYGISEAKFNVKDAREEKLVSIHGSQVWSNRQFGI